MKCNLIKSIIASLFVAIAPCLGFSEVIVVKSSSLGSAPSKQSLRSPSQQQLSSSGEQHVGYKYTQKGYAEEEFFDSLDEPLTMEDIATQAILDSE